MKKIFILLLAAVLVLAFASCGGDDKPACTAHTDADDNLLCDNCGVSFDDGAEAVIPDVTGKEVTFIVELKDGGTLSGVKFTLARGEKSFDLVSGADGSVKQTLDIGAYSVSCDYSTLPENHSVETLGFKITETTDTVKIIVVDDTPDGTEDKPFWLLDESADYTFEAGQTLHFTIRGNGEKILTVFSSDVIVTYSDKDSDNVLDTYLPEDGKVVVSIDQKSTNFSVTNTSASSATITLLIEIPLGSMGNPIVLETNSGNAAVSSATTLHYKWIADKNGVLVATTTTANANISVTRYIPKIVDNNGVEEEILIPVVLLIDSETTAYVQVNEGDEIMIVVSTENKEELLCDFALAIYAGTDSEYVPVIGQNLMVYIDGDSNFVFKGAAGKTLSVSDDKYVSITYDGITYTNENGNEISFTLSNEFFSIGGKNDEANSFVIKFN